MDTKLFKIDKQIIVDYKHKRAGPGKWKVLCMVILQPEDVLKIFETETDKADIIKEVEFIKRKEYLPDKAQSFYHYHFWEPIEKQVYTWYENLKKSFNETG